MNIGWLRSICNVTKTVALGQSMGGLPSLRALAYSSVSHWYGIYPCTNLDYLYVNQPAFLSSMNTAYGSSDHTTFLAASAGCDPMTFTQTLWNGKKLRMTASPSDTTVNKTNNSDALVTRVTGFATSAVVVAATGNHGDPSHFVPSDVVTFFNT